jgi:ketol-acid reductoisomerase
MRDLISDTAKWGDLAVGPKIVDKHVQENMAKALANIRSGKFAREFIHEMERGGTRYHTLLRKARHHPIETVGQRIRPLMGWRNK